MIPPFPSSHPVVLITVSYHSQCKQFCTTLKPIPIFLFCCVLKNPTIMLWKSTQLPLNKGQADYPKSSLPICALSILWNFWWVNPKLLHITNVKFWIKMNKMAHIHHKRTKISLFGTDCCAELGNRMLRRMFKPHKLVLSHAINVSSTRLSWAYWQGSASHQTPPVENLICSADSSS